MSVVYQRSAYLNDVKRHYCPGCSHGLAHKVVGEVLDEMGLVEKTITVASIGCSGFLYDYSNTDGVHALHGRAPAVATGVKAVHPDKIVYAYQGDGDLAAIGVGETVSAAARGAELVISLMVIVLSSIMGLNAPAILAVGASFAKPMSEQYGISPYRTANLLDAQSNTLVYALPWTPAIIFTIGFAAGTDAPLTAAQITPFVIYGYVLLVVMTASIFLGIGRKDGQTSKNA